jgi:hypothetical protein
MNRRDFVKWLGGIAAIVALGMPDKQVPGISQEPLPFNTEDIIFTWSVGYFASVLLRDERIFYTDMFDINWIEYRMFTEPTREPDIYFSSTTYDNPAR